VSEPVRFRDDGSASEDVRELLKGAARSRPMTKDARARSAARVDRLVAVPVAAGLVLWLRGVAIAAGLGVVGVVAVTQVLPALHGEPARAVPRVSVPATTGRERVEIPAPPPVATTSTSTPTPTPTSTSISTTTSDDDVLAREAALLEKARASLERDPASSLTTLDAYAAAFPTGTLSIERELLAVDALRRLGRVRDARSRGETLLGRARGSIYEERVTRILGELGAP
jgi:hypothetical protein